MKVEIPERSVGREGDAEQPLLVADQNLVGEIDDRGRLATGWDLVDHATQGGDVERVVPGPVGERHSEFEFGHRQGCHGILGPLLDVHVGEHRDSLHRGPWQDSQS